MAYSYSRILRLSFVAACVSATARQPSPAPRFTPTPAPPTMPYEVLGSIDVSTYETSIFLWKGVHYLQENIGCGYIDHAGQWDKSFEGHSYVRIRELQTGVVVANVTATIGFSFVSPFADEETGTMWLVGRACDRCHGQPQTDGVQVFWSTDLKAWSSARVMDNHTYNVQIARVLMPPPALPPHRYVMILEPFTFLLNNNDDGNLTHGWFLAPGATRPGAPGGGPSIRFENGYYYVITGGYKVELVRSRDLGATESWEGPVIMVQPTAADAIVANYADFPSEASRKGFDPMENHPERWDRYSNDGDVCCHGGDKGAWLNWGASTQGAKPTPPVTHGCTNAIGHAPNLTLAELLESFFPRDPQASALI